MNFRLYISFIAFMIVAHFGEAQIKKTVPTKTPVQTNTAEKAQLFAVASVVKGNISIRWAPSTEQAWLELNKVGYVVERYTVMRDNKFLQKPEKRVMKGTIKPMLLKYWDSTTLAKDDYAAVIAQTLYGERLEMVMQAKDKESVQALVGTSTEKVQRFAMAMYAADHSFKAAQMAGLAWHDKDVKKTEKYLYRIFSPISPKILKIDTAKVFIGLADDKPLPKPAEILPQPGDKTVSLAWEFDNFKEYYSSYYVERSDDGGASFHRISDGPITKLTGTKDGVENGSMFCSDTLTDNTTEFRYRTAGVTIFDEIGPYSDIIKVKGIAKVETAPHILGVEDVANGKGVLKWHVEDSVVKYFKYFELSTAVLAEGPYSVIKTNIPITERSIALDSISSDAAYLTMTAIPKDKDMENKVSMPFLLQAEDSIAPAIPTGLRASIDTNGIVTMNWNTNTEKDLFGYKLYKTYVKDQELTPIIDSVWFKTSFTDTVQVKNLNSKVYYSIRAVDKRYNQSEYAPVLEVKKPDLMPPSQPVFKDFLIVDTAVTLVWINSYDEDLMYTKLMRKELSESTNEWELIKQFDKVATTKYTDKTGVGGSSYAYTLISIDSANLNSTPAIPITVSVPNAFDKAAIKNFEVLVDRDKRTITLNWNIKTKQLISQIEIYKAADKEKLNLYKVIDGDSLTFVDEDLKVNTKYQYGVRVIFEDGKTSEIKIKKINY
jgi:uncharacterized protein